MSIKMLVDNTGRRPRASTPAYFRATGCAPRVRVSSLFTRTATGAVRVTAKVLVATPG